MMRLLLIIMILAVAGLLVMQPGERVEVPLSSPVALMDQVVEEPFKVKERQLIWKRDIFTPIKAAEVEKKEPEPVPRTVETVVEERPFAVNVTGILESRDENMAIVNRRIVRAGDYVQDAEVLRIEKNAVHFMRNGKKYRFELRKR